MSVKLFSVASARDTAKPHTARSQYSAPGRSLIPVDAVSTQSLSDAAQQALRLVISAREVSGVSCKQLGQHLSIEELAAVIYGSVARYYFHPEYGRLPIQWSCTLSAISYTFPELCDPTTRSQAIRASHYHESVEIVEELMIWSYHLAGTYSPSPRPVTTRPHMIEALQRVVITPVKFTIVFVAALVLGPQQKIKRSAEHDEPRAR